MRDGRDHEVLRKAVSVSNLGSVQIKIPRGSIILKVVLYDDRGRTVGAAVINPIRPSFDDWIQVEFQQKGEPDAKSKT